MPLAGREADLVGVFGPVPGLYSQIYLLTHPDLRHTPRIRAFFDFIIAELDSVRPILAASKQDPGAPPERLS
jgi:DNA-binding transcriptional LysR family regulator